ncbi:MAG: hypothetical protein EKK49_20505 [Rhodocyclaceae bacterium]|nr:MAG: hypothetical protein EKK49_20505 [Rhodocyclaceae bacterium]
MGLLGKIADLGAGLKESIASTTEKAIGAASEAHLGAKLSGLKDGVLERGGDYLTAGKDRASELVRAANKKLAEVDVEALKRSETYAHTFGKYKDLGAEKVTSYFKSTFEVDKTTAEMVEGIRNRLPSRPQDIDDIFEQCKREAFQRAISAFCLAPVMAGLDNKLEARYANLSDSYTTFKSENNLHDNPNFARMNNERAAARANGMKPLENGYNRDSPLNPYDTDIEHIIPKQQYYDDWLLRVATNDDEIIELLNNGDNLTFADERVNGSKNSKDLLDYLAYKKEKGELRADADNPDLLYLTIGDDEYSIRESDAMARYEKAQERLRQQHREALKEVGLTCASAGMRMAAQQFVGLIVIETIDIFVDEIKDIVKNGRFFDENGLLANIQARKQSISDKLARRFDERKIWARAKEAGIDGGVAGALSAIPQILISLIVKMPAFMLSIIRECTLSVVRSVRVILSDDENKFESIKVVMLGTASAVLGVYVANVISKAIRPVPMLNVFNSQVTAVLSGMVVTAVPLGAIYVFDRNKAKLTFSLLNRKSTLG